METGAAAPDMCLPDGQGLDDCLLLGRVDLMGEDPGGQKWSFGQPRDFVCEQFDCVHVLQFVGGIRGLEEQGLQAGNVLCPPLLLLLLLLKIRLLLLMMRHLGICY